MTLIEAVRGDITRQDVDAIVNAANSSLLGGGGVDGAIHRAAGPELLAACRRVRADELPDGLPAGDAIATPGFRLPARHVIHTVGPVWSRSDDRTAVLASAYRRSIEVASALGIRSVAFPAVSAGVYGWPLDDAARVAVGAVRGAVADGAAEGIELVRFVLFSDEVLAAFEGRSRPTSEERCDTDRGRRTPALPSRTGTGEWCLDAASIRGPFDFQSNALPTELPRRAGGLREDAHIGQKPSRERGLASVATLTGLEPATSAVTGRHANQLRYRALHVDHIVFRTTLPGDPNGIRTRVNAVKGRRPRPLNDGAARPGGPGLAATDTSA